MNISNFCGTLGRLLQNKNKKTVWRFMLFKIKERKQKSNKNGDKIWVQTKVCSEVGLFYTKTVQTTLNSGGT